MRLREHPDSVRGDWPALLLYLAIGELSYALLVADWSPEVALHVGMAVLRVLWYGKAGYEHRETEIPVCRHLETQIARQIIIKQQHESKSLSFREIFPPAPVQSIFNDSRTRMRFLNSRR